MVVIYEWRGAFINHEVTALHAEAFDRRDHEEPGWNWVELVHRHSLGWVVARDGTDLVGFVNVLWDGRVHAWLQDVMVAVAARRRGIGAEPAGLRDGDSRAEESAGQPVLSQDG